MSDADNRNRFQDKTEKWLYDNDPDYDRQKYKWSLRRTDALARPGLSLDEGSEQQLRREEIQERRARREESNE